MFDRVADQELLEETTRRFLETEVPPAKVRELAGSGPGFEAGYWRRGAELGWTSLVVPEQAGGGSVSGAGVVDLVLVAYEFGYHAAPGPLGPTNLVAAALGRWGTEEQQATSLGPLLAGEAIAAWAYSEQGYERNRSARPATEARTEGSTVVLSGSNTTVEAGNEASEFLVTAHGKQGACQFLVPRDAPGVTVVPMRGLDMTRRYARVELDNTRIPVSATVGGDSDGKEVLKWLADLAVLMQTAEIVGCMQWAMETTLEWATNRYSFGRPLASYQAIKHRLADMKMWLEASYAIVSEAAGAFQSDAAEQSELVSAAKFYVGRYGSEMMQDCVQLHGGIGVTFDHDIHLFLRRVTTNLPLYGSPSEHAIRIAHLLEQRRYTA